MTYVAILIASLLAIDVPVIYSNIFFDQAQQKHNFLFIYFFVCVFSLFMD